MVNVPCASGVQLEESEITGGSVGALGALGFVIFAGTDAGVSVDVLAGIDVSVANADVSAGIDVAVLACVALAALAKVLMLISPTSARKPPRIKIDLCGRVFFIFDSLEIK